MTAVRWQQVKTILEETLAQEQALQAKRMEFSFPRYARHGRGSGMGTYLNLAFSRSVIEFVFSIPLVIRTRHVPHMPKPWQFTYFETP